MGPMTIERTAPVFSIDIRIYWEDTDAGGVVYYANYLRFMERARSDWLRARGVHQRQWQQEAGIQFVVADLQLRYLLPARLDDWLRVDVQLLDCGAASMQMRQHVWRDEVLLVQGDVRVGCVQMQTLRPARIPPALRALLQA